jgi:DNA-binding MarR family transcriptional regulator
MQSVTAETELASDLVVHAARLVRAVRRELRTPAGTRVLSLLDEFGPLGVTQLADLDRSSQSSMSGAVAQLVAEGWVSKASNPDDARASLITLTDAGRAELARTRSAYGARVAGIVAAHPTITTEDLATAVAVLRAVLQKGTS